MSLNFWVTQAVATQRFLYFLHTHTHSRVKGGKTYENFWMVAFLGEKAARVAFYLCALPCLKHCSAENTQAFLTLKLRSLSRKNSYLETAETCLGLGLGSLNWVDCGFIKLLGSHVFMKVFYVFTPNSTIEVNILVSSRNKRKNQNVVCMGICLRYIGMLPWEKNLCSNEFNSYIQFQSNYLNNCSVLDRHNDKTISKSL